MRPTGSREKVKVKSLQTDKQTTDNRWSEKFTDIKVHVSYRNKTKNKNKKTVEKPSTGWTFAIQSNEC